MKTILCYGDSNTYGYDPRVMGTRYPKEIRWTTILQKLLGEEYEVINEGLNARTTAYDNKCDVDHLTDGSFRNGVKTITTIMGTHKPIDIIIFMLGTNDCNAYLELESKDICQGMEQLIKTAFQNITLFQDYLPRIIVVSPAAIGDNYLNSPFAYQLDELSIVKSKTIPSLYKELAAKYNCDYLDCSDLEVSNLDSEHLTIESHNQLAHRLYEMIK